jgi:hypothetical protein
VIPIFILSSYLIARVKLSFCLNAVPSSRALAALYGDIVRQPNSVEEQTDLLVAHKHSFVLHTGLVYRLDFSVMILCSLLERFGARGSVVG